MEDEHDDQSISRAPRRWAMATYSLVLAFAVVAVFLFRDYGISYDEGWASRHGENLVAWYTSGFQDRSFEKLSNLRYYGGLLELPTAWIGPATPMDPFEFRHLVNVLFAAMTVAGVARLSARVAGQRAAFFAVLLLVTTPRFFGHAFNNPKDIPFAAGTVWALDALMVWLCALPRPRWQTTAWLGVTLGLALAVRMNAVLILVYTAIGFGLWWRSQEGDERPTARRALLGFAGQMFGVGFVAWITLLPFWPYFQLNPVLNPLLALMRLSQGTFIQLRVLYDGQLMPAGELPSSYVWTWIAMIEPETYALGLVLALVGGVWFWRSAPVGAKRARRQLLWAVLATAILLSPVLATLTRPNLYDGVRHFLYCWILLAVPAGAGIAWAASAARPLALRATALATFLALEVLTVTDMVALHPYQAVYFNRSVAGGLQGAEGRFDTDYWGNSFREGVLWLACQAEQRLQRDGEDRRVRVVSSNFPTQTQHYLPSDRFEYIGSIHHANRAVNHSFEDPPDYYVSTTRWSHHKRYPGEIVYRVERGGVTLLVVIEVDREATLRKGSAARKGSEPRAAIR